MRKKTMVTFLAVCVLLSSGAMNVSAGRGQAQRRNFCEDTQKEDCLKVCGHKEECTAYIDKDQDGVCDNCENGHFFLDENEDGICDYKEKNAQEVCGRFYTDEDGDGICDNRKEGMCEEKSVCNSQENCGNQAKKSLDTAGKHGNGKKYGRGR